LNIFPCSYKTSKPNRRRIIVQNNYEDGIDFKIEWEKIICECKVPSGKSNNESIDIIHSGEKGNDIPKPKVNEEKKKRNEEIYECEACSKVKKESENQMNQIEEETITLNFVHAIFEEEKKKVKEKWLIGLFNSRIDYSMV
jgi:hypothetical protein